MGACCGKEAGPDAKVYNQAVRSRIPQTESDTAARAAAAEAVSFIGHRPLLLHTKGGPKVLWISEPPDPHYSLQAAARQANFEKSAVGRAAYKSVKTAKEVPVRQGGGANERDWLS